MSAYYNEFDPKAAAWLRELIAQGHIAYGDVDERSIEDVTPGDLKGYTQCHFFAGIGVWSYALRRAGWADEEPVWTGSCPCPPFSAAGKGSTCPSCGGKSCLSHPVVTAGWLCLGCGYEWRGDARHLLPELLRLVGQCRPPSVLGEQVASRDGRLWLYTLRVVMETLGYAVGGADLCAAGVGAPHIRQRLWWVGERLGDPEIGGSRAFDGKPRPSVQREQPDRGRGFSDSMEHATRDGRIERGAEPGWRGAASGRGLGGLADRDDAGLEGRGQPGRERAAERPAGPGGVAGGLAYADGRDASADRQQRGGEQRQQPQDGGTGGLAESDNPERRPDATGRHDGIGPDAGRSQGASDVEGCGGNGRPGPTNGFWRDADWLHCRDGKWRPVESGAFPLAHGSPARVGRLRGYGNAIVAPAAQAFIEAYLESRRERFRLMSDLTDDEDIFA